ncbi:conserved unknown protein [Ectocarpus siliculosus]|uniref:SET domain-containing protein n=1 Tax=Ectocarpus siliculosus TaxID=2880 RepID=D7FXM5_ECTSI|nr:conserved unknown protein [Ectocarpus siliculosus]|eukprot:CBJ26466.1 conserved unknown protein [Ectocarpus siliculosus]
MGSRASRDRQEQRAKEEAISNLQSAYVRLAPSSLEGVGVFAMRDIAEGVEVMRWDWHKYASVFIPGEELRERVPKEVFDQLRRIWHVDQHGQVATPLDFTSTLSYINFLNHSDQPNLSFRYSDGGYVTSRTVARGEELFINYDRDYYPGYTAGFRARESSAGDTV